VKCYEIRESNFPELSKIITTNCHRGHRENQKSVSREIRKQTYFKLPLGNCSTACSRRSSTTYIHVGVLGFGILRLSTTYVHVGVPAHAPYLRPCRQCLNLVLNAFLCALCGYSFFGCGFAAPGSLWPFIEDLDGHLYFEALQSPFVLQTGPDNFLFLCSQ